MAIPTNIKTLLSGEVVEWARIEFKETWDAATSLKTVCAFANDLDNWGGGYIVIGVGENNGCPVYPLKGVPTDKLDAYQKSIYAKCRMIRPAYTPIIGTEDSTNKAISLENMKVVNNSKIAQLSAEEAEYTNQIIEMQTEIKTVEAEILQAANLNIGYDYVGGEMAWPVPGYTRITSSFGMRTHPITGIYKLHTGVDISAPMGASFIAANDGVVVKSEMNTAYGNMIMINHGGGVSTLYAHGSERLVEVGQEVKRGDEVLKVGSTGYSTGPHAHFEVRINGQYVDPIPYITTTENEN